jgi:hypothetical protein
MPTLFTCAIAASFLFAPRADDRAKIAEPPELGRVRFGDDVDAGLARAAREKKLVFLLFQEIPGCATCKAFGGGPLSHPLLVEAIEDEFVPVAVHNNREGRDKQALERFGEPAWNNPVVRFLDGDGKDVLPREDGLWTEGAIAARMVRALEKSAHAVPDWLALAREETESSPTQQATFAMHCYWEGQGRLGALPGVIAVEPGFVGGAEVVLVTFRPKYLAYADLVAHAERLDCALFVYTHSEEQARIARARIGDRAQPLASPMRKAAASEHLYHLQRTSLRFVPMTELQATRVNASLAQGADPAHWMSPRQRAIAQRIERVLRTDPERFAGLKRPSSTADLAGYTAEIESRLSRAP